jgi:peptidoglycan/LPS O-acetylase OafA/YrhL
LAILLVVGFHFLPSITGQYELGWRGMWRNVDSVKTPLIWWLYPLSLGWSGVSLFFVISGFCIHHSFFKSESAFLQKSYLKQFLWKRFWRIYPPYVIALMVFNFLVTAHPNFSNWSIDFWLHLFLVHNFAGNVTYGINPSFWSLALEVQFYLLFPLVLLMRNRMGIKKVFWFFAAVSLVSRILTCFLQDWSQPPALSLWNYTMTLFIDWLMGAWLAEKWQAKERLVGASPGKILLLGFLAVVITWNKITMAFMGFTAFSLLYVAILEYYLYSPLPFSWLEKRMVPIGVCSYSIYLWHQPLLDFTLHELQKFGLPQTPMASLAALPVILLAMILLGFVSYKLIELPSITIGKWFSHTGSAKCG